MRSVQVDGRWIKPSKVVCIGRNYVEHIRELGNEIPDEMVVFIKPNSAISDRLCAERQEQLHYEGELSFIYEKGKFSAVGFGLDLTKRGLQANLKEKGLPWERAKAFDGSALFSPFVAFNGMSALSFALDINAVPMQLGDLNLMMYKPDEILTELLTFMTLEDGDIVMTGTPKGVGYVAPGDLFEGKVYAGGNLLVSASWVAE